MGVELGQHEEQDAGLARALGRCGPVGERDPVVDHRGQRRDLEIGGRDAQQHRGQLLLGDVAVEQIGDLAAQEGLLERVLLVEELGQRQWLARARARKVEQIGVREERPGLLGHHDPELGGECRDHRPRQLHRRSREAPDRELLLIPVAEPGQGRDVDDALLARDQGLDRAERLGRVTEPLERCEQGPGEVENRSWLPQSRLNSSVRASPSSLGASAEASSQKLASAPR